MLDFFADLWDFFVNLFVPTDNQWEQIENNNKSIKETISHKIPFVSWFSGELDKFNTGVDTTDFLNLHFDGWNFDLGVIKINTPPVDFTGVRDAYEPYRVEIRSLLALIVYALGAVYLVKYFVRYGQTEALDVAVKGGDAK